MQFLITGASGFVSRCVADAAKQSGHQVCTLSRRDDSWQPDPGRLAEVLQGLKPDVIFHGAGSSSVAASVKDPAADHAASVGTWMILLEAVTLSGLKPMVLFPSSAAVYGNPVEFPVAECSATSPISPYGRHKLECERMAAKIRESSGIPIYILRLFSLFGPGQRRLLVHELFEQACAGGQCLTLAGTGNETRDYLDAAAFGQAVIRLAEHHREGILPPEPWKFNLASGTETRIYDLARMIAGRLGRNLSIICRNEVREGDPLRWVADMSAFRSAVPEWNPRKLEDALDETLAVWQKEDQAL